MFHRFPTPATAFTEPHSRPLASPQGRMRAWGMPLALAIAVSAVWAPVVLAQDAPAASGLASDLLSFDIPPAPLNQVLTRLANESGILLAATPALVANRHSNGVRGRHTSQDAWVWPWPARGCAPRAKGPISIG
ncbi:hypothetical protein [Achromobacter deleyi]|uniref:hypothetical protein n=1 Tax=Achromobacter deleyi TaxID=1353891 RepID=UPI001F338767|nr:hypothetical protein [Achromobacter deleyi]UIP21623.1 hypothetical protein LYZ39_03640 [Achromobacter deleyi]